MPWPNGSLLPQTDAAFFREHGDRASWYQGVICSCVTQGSDMAHAQVSCKVCGGLGRFYPNAPVYINGTVSNALQDRQLLATGFAISDGDLVFSSDPWGDWNIGPLDLLIFDGDPHQWPFEGQVLIRGTGTIDSLWYTATDLQLVTQSNPSTGVVTQYSGMTVSGKSVDWSNATTSPTAGTAYSVKYRAQYEWVCYVPPMVRFEHTQSLGQKVVLRKRHLVINSATGVSPMLQA